jgi:hypothetical protein
MYTHKGPQASRKKKKKKKHGVQSVSVSKGETALATSEETWHTSTLNVQVGWVGWQNQTNRSIN